MHNSTFVLWMYLPHEEQKISISTIVKLENGCGHFQT